MTNVRRHYRRTPSGKLANVSEHDRKRMRGLPANVRGETYRALQARGGAPYEGVATAPGELGGEFDYEVQRDSHGFVQVRYFNKPENRYVTANLYTKDSTPSNVSNHLLQKAAFDRRDGFHRNAFLHTAVAHDLKARYH